MRLFRRRLIYSILCLVAWIGLAPLTARAQPTTAARFDSSTVVYRHWTVGSGLPQSTVSGIAQTPDGYLWIGTNGGLVRFDGARFTLFNRSNTPALPSNRIYQLGLDSAGTLWVGTSTGITGRRLDGRWLTPSPDDLRLIDNRGGDQVNGMIVAWDGKVAALLPGVGILLVERGRWRLLDRRAGFLDLDKTQRIGMAFDGRSQLHLVGIHGLSRVGSDGRLFTVPWATAGPSPRITSLWIDPVTGQMIAGTITDGAITLRLDTKGQLTWTPLPLGVSINPVPHVFSMFTVFGQNADGVLRVRTADGVAEVHPNGSLTVDPGPGGAFRGDVLRCFVDRTGSLWIGTGSQGLFQRQRPPFRVIGPADGMPKAAVQAITEDRDGRIWFGTNFGGLACRLPSGQIRHWVPSREPSIWSLLMGRTGRLWFGSYGGGLYWLDPATVLNHLDAIHPQPLPPSVSKVVFALWDDPDGSLWVGTRTGLAHLTADGRPIRVYDERDGLGSSWVRCVMRDRTGALWVATAAGAARLDGRADRFTTFTTADGLGSNDVRNVVEDREGQLWIGTYDGGIAGRVPGTDRFVAIRTAEGLADDGVFSILEDDHGGLWTGGNQGVQRLDRSELLGVVAGTRRTVTPVVYGAEQGLSNPETNGGFMPAGWRDREGRLWFPTLIGAAVIDPDAIARTTPPPPVHIEGARLDTDPLAITDSTIRLHPSRGRLEIDYTAISLRAPNGLRFRYRLDGVDADWVEVGTRRVAIYTNLPAGTFAFRAQATGGQTPWADAEARLTVVREPFFYERWAFRLLLVALILLGIYLFVRLRLSRLRRRAAALEATVAARTQDLEGALVEVEAARRTVAGQAEALVALDRAKSRFFVNLSHEFRSPLTLIVGPLEGALDGSYGALPTPLRAQHEVMLRHGQRLLRLINQMLDLARLESGGLTVTAHPVDLADFTRQVGSMFSSVAGRRGLALRLDLPDEPVVALADEEKLEQIVSNLLSNAVKFTPSGGTITLGLAADPTGDSWRLRWTVADTGIGIPADHLTKVFDRFHQVDDSATRSGEGSGVGLALVKELVGLIGGEITVESSPGSGAMFTVRLSLPRAGSVAPFGSVAAGPVRQIEPSPVAPPVETPISAPPLDADAPLVLVVEDNADLRRFIVDHLAAIVRTAQAGDGIAGLRLAREIVPDLILSDVMMPGMDGLAFCRAVKTDPALDHIPVALLTARVGSEHRIEGIEHGADAYLGKPFRPKELRATILGLIETRRRLHARYRTAPESISTAPAESAPVPMPLTPSLSRADRRFLTELEDRLVTHVGEADFNVDDLAQELGLSRVQLYRKLKAITGETPADRLRRLRLDRAADLLRVGKLTVSEIAYTVGFNSPSHFGRAFRAHFGRTPTEHAALEDVGD